MLRELTLEGIAFAEEGRIKAAVDMHLKKCTADCVDRPGSDKARKVVLELLIVPLIDPDTGQCDEVSIDFEIGSSVPKHRSRPVNCKIRKRNGETQLLFNDLSEDDVNQRTLDQQSPGFLPPRDGVKHDDAA